MKLIVDEMPYDARDCFFFCGQRDDSACELCDGQCDCDTNECSFMITLDHYIRTQQEMNTKEV